MSNRFKCPVAVFVLLFDSDKKLIMQYRENCTFADHYSLIGGHIDGGESLVSAIIREAKEEVGVDIDENNLKLATICHNNEGGKEYLQFYFVCDSWNGNLENKEPERCCHIKSFDINNLPENTVSYIKKAIYNINNNIPFYENGF